MAQNNRPTFEELEALLNYPREGGFSSMGEVASHMAEANQTAHLLMEKTSVALAVLSQVIGMVGEKRGRMSNEVMNLNSCAELLHTVTQMALDAISHDVVISASFIDAASGEDRSSN